MLSQTIDFALAEGLVLFISLHILITLFSDSESLTNVQSHCLAVSLVVS